jgi:hypothetical protein
MVPAMGVRKTITRVRRIVGKGLRRVMNDLRLFSLLCHERSRFVHVGPKTRNTFVEMLLELTPKPFTRSVIRKIGKGRRLWPNIPVQLGTVGIFYEHSLGTAV